MIENLWFPLYLKKIICLLFVREKKRQFIWIYSKCFNQVVYFTSGIMIKGGWQSGGGGGGSVGGNFQQFFSIIIVKYSNLKAVNYC